MARSDCFPRALSLEDREAGHLPVVTIAPGTVAWDVFTAVSGAGRVVLSGCELCYGDIYREHDGSWHHD